MEDKQFEEKLLELAELKPKKPAKSPNFRVDENSGGEVRWRNQIIDVNEDQNPTLNYQLTKVKSQERPCSLGCGDIVKDQVTEHRWNLLPQPHWRTKCTNCNLYLSPDEQGFLAPQQIHEAWKRHFIDKKNSKE